jgi:hypothetical protein
MAFSVRITGYSKATKEPLLEMEPAWWPVDELKNDSRLRASDAHGYLDYDADLSVEEARELHERYKPAATQGVYDYGPWQKLIQPMLKELDLALGPWAPEFSHFHVHVFEWESGLG